jgi:hypothetical protein
MDMVCQATKAVNAAGEFLHCLLHEEIQTVPVAVVEKDRLPGVTAEDDMVDRTGEMDVRFSCHGGIIQTNSRKSNLSP